MYALYGIVAMWLSPSLADVKIARGEHALADFSLEVADSIWRRAHGLMGRTHLPNRGGMLFVYGRPRPVRIWMAGTPLGLDVLFVDGAGRISKIAREMAPGSANQADSEGPVQWVVEVAAGTVERFGIAVGDTVSVSVTKA